MIGAREKERGRRAIVRRNEQALEGTPKGHPVLESGRCVRDRPNRGAYGPRGIINQNIYAQGRARVQRVAPSYPSIIRRHVL